MTSIPKKWLVLLAEQARSGLTPIEFCRRYNINPSTFSARKSELKQQQNNAFVELEIPKNSPSILPDLSHLPNLTINSDAINISFPDGIDLPVFAQLIQLLKVQ